MTADDGNNGLHGAELRGPAESSRAMSIRRTLGLPERPGGTAANRDWLRWAGAGAMATGILAGGWFLLDQTVFAIGGGADSPPAPFSVVNQSTTDAAATPTVTPGSSATGTPAMPSSTGAAVGSTAPRDAAPADPAPDSPVDAPATSPPPASGDDSPGHDSGDDDSGSGGGDGDSSGSGSGGGDDDSSGHGSGHD